MPRDLSDTFVKQVAELTPVGAGDHPDWCDRAIELAREVQRLRAWKGRHSRRWTDLKLSIRKEIDAFSGFPGQQGAAYANRIAGLRWVLDEMDKSPDVLHEAVPTTTEPTT